MVATEIVEGALRQHTEGAAAAQHRLRHRVDGAVAAGHHHDAGGLAGGSHGGPGLVLRRVVFIDRKAVEVPAGGVAGLLQCGQRLIGLSLAGTGVVHQVERCVGGWFRGRHHVEQYSPCAAWLACRTARSPVGENRDGPSA